MVWKPRCTQFRYVSMRSSYAHAFLSHKRQPEVECFPFDAFWCHPPDIKKSVFHWGFSEEPKQANKGNIQLPVDVRGSRTSNSKEPKLKEFSLKFTHRITVTHTKKELFRFKIKPWWQLCILWGARFDRAHFSSLPLYTVFCRESTEMVQPWQWHCFQFRFAAVSS